ncbi:MAG: beta-galactosidase trimerization domain-containing protein [Candidatus Moduliflexus flocculans]|nr:beta-galactosidase trimerization domain-containing protein [Candidatus Moduliflexus flocculans]
MYPVRGVHEPRRARLPARATRTGWPWPSITSGSFKGVTGVMELQPGQVNWAAVNPAARARGRPDVAVARLRRRAVVRLHLPLPPAALRQRALPRRHRRAGRRDACRGAAREFVQVIGEMRRAARALRPGGDDAGRASRPGGRPSSGARTSCGTSRSTGRPTLWDTRDHRNKWIGRGQGGRGSARLHRRGRRLRGLSVPGRAGLPARRRGPGRQVDALRRGRRPPRPDLPHRAEGHARAAAGGAVGRARSRRSSGPGVELFDGLLEGGAASVRMGGRGYAWNRWADVLAPAGGPGTETLAVYADQFYAGKPAVVTRRLGKGTVTYVGRGHARRRAGARASCASSTDGPGPRPRAIRRASTSSGATASSWPSITRRGPTTCRSRPGPGSSSAATPSPPPPSSCGDRRQ